MHKTIRTVPLSDISLNDLSFVATAGRNTAALQGSIATCGLLQPPCLWRSGPDALYVIVCGYLRLLALRNLGRQELSARVFAPETPRAVLLECALQDNLAHRAFNPVEIALALQRLLECFPRNTVVSEWLPRFRLSPSARTLERFLCLSALEQEQGAALIAGTLTEASALKLCAFSVGDRSAVFALMQQLHLSAGKQAELLECLEDLARRDKTSLREEAEAVDIEQVCANQTLNRVQKTEQVRRILRARRYPRLNAADERFAAALKDVHVPAGIRIMPPPNFEGQTCRAEISFRSIDELRQRSRALLNAAQQKAFERLCAENSAASDCTDETC